MSKTPKIDIGAKITEAKKASDVIINEGFDILAKITIGKYIDVFVEKAKTGKVNVGEFKTVMETALRELHSHCNEAFDRQVLAINADIKSNMDLLLNIPRADELKSNNIK